MQGILTHNIEYDMEILNLKIKVCFSLHKTDKGDRMNSIVDMLSLPIAEGVSIMEIIGISIQGFKNIAHVSVQFSDVTAFVSPNGYGKSNLMSAIRFATNFISANNEAKNRMMSHNSNVPLTKENPGQDFSAEFELLTMWKKKPYYIVYKYGFAWKTVNRRDPIITNESLRIKEKGKRQKLSGFLYRHNSVTAIYKTSEQGRCDHEITVESSELLINKLKAYDDLFYAEVIRQINSLRVYVEQHMDASPLYRQEVVVAKDTDPLDPRDLQAIPRAICLLQESYPNKYALLIDAFLQLFPNILSISPIKSSSDLYKKLLPRKEDFKNDWIILEENYNTFIKDKNLIQPIEFSQASAGVKKVFLMLTSAILADLKGIPLVIFEEPENAIHPALLQSFLRVLSQLISNCKVVLVSHSPHLVSYIVPENIYIGVPNNSGNAIFKKFSRGQAKRFMQEASKLHISTGEFLFDLLSGSEEELNYLCGFMEE